MFIDNIETLDQNNIFICKDDKVMNFLCIDRNLPLLGEKIDKTDNSICWVFVRTDKLILALSEWAEQNTV